MEAGWHTSTYTDLIQHGDHARLLQRVLELEPFGERERAFEAIGGGARPHVDVRAEKEREIK